VCVLVHHAADIVRIITGEDPVDDDLSDRHLTADRFSPSFEIDRIGKAFLILGAGRADEAKASGGAVRPMLFTGDLTIRREALVRQRFERRHLRRCDGRIWLLRFEHRGLSGYPRF